MGEGRGRGGREVEGGGGGGGEGEREGEGMFWQEATPEPTLPSNGAQTYGSYGVQLFQVGSVLFAVASPEGK